MELWNCGTVEVDSGSGTVAMRVEVQLWKSNLSTRVLSARSILNKLFEEPFTHAPHLPGLVLEREQP